MPRIVNLDKVYLHKFNGQDYDYELKRSRGKTWVEIRDRNSVNFLFDYTDGLDAERLTTFIDELMEIRDYINTHPEFQGGNEE